MDHYLISGGSGFIGKSLCHLLLQQGHHVSILSTKPNYQAFHPNIQVIGWDTQNKSIHENLADQSYHVINLAGAGVADKRWTAKRKREILQSRQDALDTLFLAQQQGKLRMSHLTSASAIGYYGLQTGLCDELTAGDESFLSEVCQQWEQSASRFQSLQIPMAIVRVGIVLGKEGGAFKEFIKPMKFGIAGIPGHGKQLYSWIHVHDITALFYFVSQHQLHGVYNGVAPRPVSLNRLFDEIVKHKKGVFAKIHAPAWIINMALGGMSIEILKSTEVSSNKIQQAGFQFKFKEIQEAIRDLTL